MRFNVAAQWGSQMEGRTLGLPFSVHDQCFRSSVVPWSLKWGHSPTALLWRKYYWKPILITNPGLLPFMHLIFVINLFFNSLGILLFYGGILITMLYNKSMVVLNSEMRAMGKIIPREKKKDGSETEIFFSKFWRESLKDSWLWRLGKSVVSLVTFIVLATPQLTLKRYPSKVAFNRRGNELWVRFSQFQKITFCKQIAISGENQFTEVMSLNFIAKLQMMNSINFSLQLRLLTSEERMLYMAK